MSVLSGDFRSKSRRKEFEKKQELIIYK